MSQTPKNTNPGIVIADYIEFDNTNINVILYNMDDVSSNPYELEEDAYFTLTIKRGIETFYTENLIDYECVLYEDNKERARFNPAELDKIDVVITFPKASITVQSTKLLRFVPIFSKDENSWTLQQQKERINNMDFSGYSLINIEVSNPVNCNIMAKDYFDTNKKLENFYKFKIYHKLNTSWPMLLKNSYKKNECFNVDLNNISIGFHQNLDLIKFLITKDMLWDYTLMYFDVKYYIKDRNGFKITYREYLEYKSIDDEEYKSDNISEEKYWMPQGSYGGVRTGSLYYIGNQNQKLSQLEDLKFTLKGTINEDNNVMPIDQIINEDAMSVSIKMTYTPRLHVADMFKDVVVYNGVYFCNDKIPIIVNFNKLLNLQYANISLIVNNQELSYIIPNNCSLMFFYPVTSNSPTEVTIEKIKCNGQYIYGEKEISQTMPCTLVPIRICNALQDIEAYYTTDYENYKNTVDIKVNLVNGNTKYNDYYNNDIPDNTDKTSQSVYAVIIDKENNKTVVDNIKLTYSKDDDNNYYLTGSCQMNVNIENTVHKYGVQLYARDIYKINDNNSKIEVSSYSPVYRKTFDFEVNPVKYVNTNDIELIIPNNGPESEKYWPSKEENIIYNTNRELVELDYRYEGEATFASEKDFQWSIYSVDGQPKADIVNKKYIQPLAPGDIIVQLTATNGNVNPSKNVTVSSDTIQIIYKDDPSLIIPTSFSNVEIIDGDNATIRYIQNLTEAYKDKDVNFNVNLYDGNYTMEELENLQPLYIMSFTRNSTSPDKNQYIIPANLLTLGPSKENTPKYTVLIKSKNPYNETEELYDIAYITVIAKQIKFNLDCGDKTTYIDNSDNPNKKTVVNITWEVENIDDVNGAEVTFQIDRNGVILLDSIKGLSDMIKQSDGKYSGSYDLEIKNVEEYTPKDVYTIFIKGKNLGHKEYSFDSRVLNVFSANSMKILINNQDITTYEMNNYEYINSLNLNQLSSQEIEKLRKELNLKANANIKASSFDEYEDLLSWKTSNHDKLTINYFNGVNYQDIDKTIYKYFTPSKQLLLSGVQDGKVTVTAIHAQTNREDEVEINISSLKDKFYLFKFYPKVKTTVNYTDDQNNKRSITSNDEGMLALYEPNTINSDIYAKSEYNNEIYLGTILKINLLSGEKDVTKNALYPINYFTLRRISVVDIYLKKDEATPYKGRVEVHGGVYKNDGYCQSALINDKTGKEGIVIKADNNGHISLNMDATQFWSKDLGEEGYVDLSSQDRLKFILEIYILDENYYPTIIYLDGNENADETVRFGNSVINLRKITDNKRQTPFIVNQSISYEDTKKGPTILTDDITKIGPSDKHPQVKLNTDMMMWGIDSDTAKEFELRCKDKQNKGEIAQSSQIIEYPFAKVPIARNTVDLSKEKIWISQLEQTKIKFELLDKNGKVLKSEDNKSQIVNMCGVESVENSNEVTLQLDKLKKSTSISGISVDIGDALIKEGIKILSAIGMQGAFFKMAISSTKDPSIYRVFLWAGNSDTGLNIPDSSDIVVLDELENRGLSTVPEIGDLVSMAKGKYLKEQENTLNNNLNSTKKTSSNTDFSVGLGGYFLAEVDFDYDITKWDFCILSGGFTASASMEYKWTYNSMVGPIPITAYIKFGGGIGANFNVIARRSQLPSYPWDGNYPYKKANDYLTKINANVYIRAFAGIGFDVSVLALRIGIFGQVDVKFETAFLSRIYLSDVNNRELNGQYLQLLGTIGIEFAVKILFIKYEKVLASVSAGKTFTFNKYDHIEDYWKNNSNVLGYGDFSTDNNNEGEFEVVSSTRTIENRNYLDKYERYWADSNNISILSSDELSILQQNAYPNSEPRLSNDGSILIYLSDENSNNISDTKLCYSFKNPQGKFEQGIVIPSSTSGIGVVFDGYGDCNSKIDGNKDFAAVTWVRLREDMDISEGSTLSDYEQLYMLNSTEVMLSIWQNNAWNTIRVTEDTTPDLAPVVATNGDSVLLAWRNVYCNNDENPLDFSIKDNIDFVRISKDNLVIDETHNLYNGSSGAIKGLDLAMLKDGTSCVLYVADLSKENIESEFEIFYSIINPNNEIIKNVRLTSDEYLNENPKISTVTLKSGEEKFVIAYHTVKKSEENILSDIRLAFVDKEGTLDANILEAVSEKVGEDNIEVSGKYEFVKVDKEDNTLENLALMWTEAYLSIDETGNKNADKDTLKVVKFVENMDNQISLSSPINICVMPDRTLVDAFDCSMDNNFKINAVLLGSEYTKIDLDDPSTYREIMYGDTPVYISNFISNLYTLDSIMKNSISIEDIYVDYNTVKINMNILVLFTLKNDGMDTITNLKIKLDTQEYDFNNIVLNPNEKIEIPVVYEIGDEINNLSIIITGKTINNEIITQEDELYLDYPDIGISKVETTSEEDGVRRVRVTLYNSSQCKLAKINRSVVLGVYEDSECSKPMDYITFINNDESNPTQHEILINKLEDLAAIDGGYFTTVFDFNIKEYLGEGIEIPNSGLQINMKAEIKEVINNEEYVLPEIDSNNNISYCTFESLLNKYKEDFTVSVVHEIVNNQSVGDITIKNNSLKKVNGRLLAKLLDENENVIDSRVIDRDDFIIFNSNNLLLNEEEELRRSINFDKSGKSIVVEYNNDTPIEPDIDETSVVVDYDFNEVPRKTKAHFEVFGAGMDNEDQVIGDIRWKPLSYKVVKGENTGVYDCFEYKEEMYFCYSCNDVIKKFESEYFGVIYVNGVGKYTVYVTLQKEKYNGSDWISQDIRNTLEYDFVVER